MFIYSIYFLLICLPTIGGVVHAIKNKSIGDLLTVLLFFPFFFYFFIGTIFGGSALHDAKNDYELYVAGHYYLVDHGEWTEVSYQKYLFVLISQIIGFSSFALTLILQIIKDNISKPKSFRPLNRPPK